MGKITKVLTMNPELDINKCVYDAHFQVARKKEWKCKHMKVCRKKSFFG